MKATGVVGLLKERWMGVRDPGTYGKALEVVAVSALRRRSCPGERDPVILSRRVEGEGEGEWGYIKVKNWARALEDQGRFLTGGWWWW
jgi:hypothetical protein